jgi:hypothetical protein
MSRRHHEDETRCGCPERLGEVVGDIIDRLRFHRQVERLHSFGPRATGELLLEIAECLNCRTFVDQRLKAYADLDPEVVKALHGDTFPRPTIYEVKT